MFRAVLIERRPDRPTVDQSYRGDPECQYIGEGIELDADLGRRSRHSSNAAVQCVEEYSKADRYRRVIEVTRSDLRAYLNDLKTSDRIQYGKKAHRDIRGSESSRDDVQAFFDSAMRGFCFFG